MSYIADVVAIKSGSCDTVALGHKNENKMRNYKSICEKGIFSILNGSENF